MISSDKLNSNQKMKYRPISLNPEQTHKNQLSPINMMITNKRASYKGNLHIENNKLRDHIKNLQQQLEARKNQNIKLSQQLQKSRKKVQCWHRCFQEGNEQYVMKIEKLRVLQKQLGQFSNKNSVGYSKAKGCISISNKKSEKLNTDIESSGERNWSKGDKIAECVRVHQVRINSLAQQQKKSKKRQALSLTNLHKFKYQSAT